MLTIATRLEFKILSEMLYELDKVINWKDLTQKNDSFLNQASPLLP